MIGISEVVKSIKDVFEGGFRSPANVISSLILICSLAKRPGLSAILSTSKVLQSLSQRGIPTEDLPDGTKNMMNQVIYETMNEAFRAIREDMNIQVGLEPGSISVTAMGGNSGGPVVVKGMNDRPVHGNALAQ